MWYAQQRYWGDHPRVDQMIAHYLGYKDRKTPPSGKAPKSKLNWALLDAPAAPPARKRKPPLKVSKSVCAHKPKRGARRL